MPDKPGSSFEIFKRLADRKITVDMIVQNIGQESHADISFTVPGSELKSALKAVNEANKVVGATGVTHDDSVAKVSVVGVGMSKQTGVAQKMFEALSNANINIQMITTSEIKISALVDRSDAQAALRAVHNAFDLHVKPADANVWEIGQKQTTEQLSINEIVEKLRSTNMEQLTLLDVSLLGNQARVTLSGVPDKPGLAEKIFKYVASAGIFVDMIVQSYDGYQGETAISFTIPDEQLDSCIEMLQQSNYGFRKVAGSKGIAKLSVSGIGLRSHTSVAIAMFKALAENGINVLMINTSELRVNVIVEAEHAQKGLEALQKIFAESLV